MAENKQESFDLFRVESGRILRNLRLNMNITQDEAAASCHISRQKLSDIETGKTTVSLYDFLNLTRYYQVTLNDPRLDPVLGQPDSYDRLPNYRKMIEALLKENHYNAKEWKVIFVFLNSLRQLK